MDIEAQDNGGPPFFSAHARSIPSRGLKPCVPRHRPSQGMRPNSLVERQFQYVHPL